MIKDVEECVQKWRCWLFYAYRLYTHRPADCVFAQRILTHFDFVFLRYTKSPLNEKGSLSLSLPSHTRKLMHLSYVILTHCSDSYSLSEMVCLSIVLSDYPFRHCVVLLPSSQNQTDTQCVVCVCAGKKKSLLYRRVCARIHAHTNTHWVFMFYEDFPQT